MASQALNLILTSIGPHTVVPYLNFALGKPISPPQQGEPDAGVGLESLAESLNHHHHTSLVEPSTPLMGTFASLNKVGTSSPSDCLSLCSEDSGDEEPSFHYGAISNKIGEAAACWLARWGPDILAYETSALTLPSPQERRRRPASTSTHFGSTKSVPVIWARGGLSPKWVAAIVSSDAFFVRAERERYDFARTVVELRRSAGIIEAEEQEWSKMFAHGIYYTNMVVLSVTHTPSVVFTDMA
jgi:hypothetical protein